MSTTLEPQRVLDNLRPHRRALERRLASLRRRMRLALAVEGAVWALGTIGLLAALSLAVDRWLRLGTPTRLALAAVGAVIIAVVIYRKLISPLRLSLDDLDLAHVLDRRERGVAELIANVLQLPLLLENGHHASPSMVDAAVRRHSRDLERLELESLIDARRRRKLLAAIAVLVAVAVSFPVLWPQTARIWAKRWLLGSSVRWPQRTYLSVRGLGDGEPLLAARGEPLLVEVTAQPKFKPAFGGWLLEGRGEPLLVDSSEQPTSEIPDQVSIVHRALGSKARQGNFTHFEGGNFRYELPPILEPTYISITADDDWLGPVEVQPIDRPTISSLTLLAHSPGQKQPTRHAVGEGDRPLTFLPETQLELDIESRQPLADAELVRQGELVPLARVSNQHYRAGWKMKEATTLELRLIGQVGRLSSKPYFVTIGLLMDREPRVMLRSSGVGRRITPQATVPLSVRVVDDFGIESLGLEIEKTIVEGEKLQAVTVKSDLGKPDAGPAREAIDLERSHPFAVQQHNLSPGNMLKLRVAAVDNCLFGSHTGFSRWLTFQIVSPEELFYEILTRQREQRAKFSAALVAAKTQSEMLDRLSKPADVTGLTRSHQVLARQVWQIANQLDASLEEMKLNDLGTGPARQLMTSNIIGPMRALHSDQFRRLRENFDRLSIAKTINPNVHKSAQAVQAESIKIMQRILEQMTQWESFVDVVNQLRQVLRLQGQVLKATEETQKNRTEGLFDD